MLHLNPLKTALALWLPLIALACTPGGPDPTELTLQAQADNLQLTIDSRFKTEQAPTPTPTLTLTPDPRPSPTATPTPIVLEEPTPTVTPILVFPGGGAGPGVNGFAWEDRDNNGLRSDDEMPLAGVPVKLFVVEVFDTYHDESGTYDNLNGYAYVVAETVTDAGGFYHFDFDDEAKRRNYPHYIQFGRVSGYGFTVANVDPDDEIDSDAEKANGETTTFSPGIPFTQMDAGYVLQTEALPAPNTAFTVTGSVSDVIGAPFITLPDETNDTFVCATGEMATDPEVDINTILTSAAEDWLTWQIDMMAPLASDYSFATAVFSFEQESPLWFYLWEVHAAEFRIGALDVNTGLLLPETDPPLSFLHDTANGRLLLILPRSQVPGNADLVTIRTFHTGMEGQQTTCDDAGPFTLPAAWSALPPQTQNE